MPRLNFSISWGDAPRKNKSFKVLDTWDKVILYFVQKVCVYVCVCKYMCTCVLVHVCAYMCGHMYDVSPVL